MTEQEMAHQIAERFLAMKKRVVALEIELDTHYQGGEPMPWRELVDSSLAVPVSGDQATYELSELDRAIDPSLGTGTNPIHELYRLVFR
jgi:hypothetical protein